MTAGLRDSLCWRGIKQSRWLDEDWLRDRAPADPLSDIKTQGNALSVYLVPKSDASQWGRRVAAALGARRDSLDHYEYVFFEASALRGLRVKVDRSLGETPDREVNQRHAELVRLTARQLARIADLIWKARRDGFVRLLEPDVAGLISSGIQANQIERAQVKPAILTGLRNRSLIH